MSAVLVIMVVAAVAVLGFMYYKKDGVFAAHKKDGVFAAQWTDLPASAWLDGSSAMHGSAQDVKGCKKQCTSVPACTGYAWSPKTNECYSMRGATKVWADDQNGGWFAGVRATAKGVPVK